MTDTGNVTDGRRDLRDQMARLLLRDLGAVRRELEAYPDDAGPWRELPGVTNAGGTLALHLAGNIQSYIGTVLGANGYVRDREREFSRRDVPRAELVQGIDAAIAAVRTTLASLDPARLSATYPLEIGGVTLRTDLFLLHLCTHLTYHLGQIDYHRRAVTGSAATVGTVAVTALDDSRA